MVQKGEMHRQVDVGPGKFGMMFMVGKSSADCKLAILDDFVIDCSRRRKEIEESRKEVIQYTECL